LQASSALLTAIRQRIVPPGSPVFPGMAFLTVVTFTSQPTEVGLQINQPVASSAGWKDARPWPPQPTDATLVTGTVASQTSITLSLADDPELPNGQSIDVPSLMAWNLATSRWESLLVSQVERTSATNFTITLSSAPSFTMPATVTISPDTARRDVIAKAIESYVDNIGPGEVVDIDTDPRAAMAFRRPTTSEKRGHTFGSAVANGVGSALGLGLVDVALTRNTVSTPSIPVDAGAGPKKITLGEVGVYKKL